MITLPYRLPPRGAPDHHLTPRQREILILMAQDYTAREVADRLCLSRDTVKTHLAFMRERMEVHSVIAALAMAIRTGQIDVTDLTTDTPKDAA